MGHSVIFIHWSCMGIDIRVAWYFRILALPKWCFGCKSRKTYWIWLQMTEYDISLSQWNFKFAHVAMKSRLISFLNNINIEFYLSTVGPSCRETFSCAPIGQLARLPACNGRRYSEISLGCRLAVRCAPLNNCHCGDRTTLHGRLHKFNVFF